MFSHPLLQELGLLQGPEHGSRRKEREDCPAAVYDAAMILGMAAPVASEQRNVLSFPVG